MNSNGLVAYCRMLEVSFLTRQTAVETQWHDRVGLYIPIAAAETFEDSVPLVHSYEVILRRRPSS